MHVTRSINLYFSAQTRREGARRGFPWGHMRGGTEASLIWCKPPGCLDGPSPHQCTQLLQAAEATLACNNAQKHCCWGQCLHFPAAIQSCPWRDPPLPKSVWLFPRVTASAHPGSWPQVPSGPWALCAHTTGTALHPASTCSHRRQRKCVTC